MITKGYEEREGDTKFQVWFLHQKIKDLLMFYVVQKLYNLV